MLAIIIRCSLLFFFFLKEKSRASLRIVFVCCHGVSNEAGDSSPWARSGLCIHRRSGFLECSDSGSWKTSFLQSKSFGCSLRAENSLQHHWHVGLQNLLAYLWWRGAHYLLTRCIDGLAAECLLSSSLHWPLSGVLPN